MVELTAKMIIGIHDTIIQRYGGLPGISLAHRSLSGSSPDACAAQL
jgi:hypothetical protein